MFILKVIVSFWFWVSYFDLLVDCIWGEWQNGGCSEECGGGTRINKRSPTVEASFGGKECFGFSNVTEICNIQECPGIYNLKPITNI